MSDELFDIGGQGIDTQYERDYINYRPKITYTSPLIDSTYGLSADTASQESELDQIGDSSVISTWEDVIDVLTEIDKLEEQLSETLKDISVPIPASFQDDIKKAAEKLEYPGITDSIPFALYKKSFDFPSPESSLIQDMFEEYMSDVNGNLNGELYADVMEIKQDWVDVTDFIKKGLFTQIVSLDKVPTDLDKENPALIEIKEKEEAMADEYARLLRLRSINEEIYYQLSESEYGSERYYQAVKDLDDTRRQVVNLEKKLFTKTEVVDLIGRKASDTSDSVSLITNSIDFDPYEEDKYEVLYGLLKQFKTKESMTTGLKKMQAVLKLSVDGKKNNTDSLKLNLRGIAGRTTKRKINQTLVNGIHLRNEIFGEVYDIMSNIDGIPSSENFEMMADHISDGVQQSESMYRQQASDFYKVHMMDASLRTEKLVSLIDKDAARSTYKLLGGVVNYTKDVNTSWPAEDQMSTWLNDFMEHSKIK